MMNEDNYNVAGEDNCEPMQKKEFSSLVKSVRDGKLVLYGAGNIGKQICDVCRNHGIKVAYFVDKGKTGDYRGVPILPWSSLESDFRNDSSHSIVITVHNRDEDIPSLKTEISSALGDGSKVYSLMEFYLAMEQEGVRFPDQFWLGQNFAAHEAKIEEARALWTDQKSLTLYDAQVELRKTGRYSSILSFIDEDDFYLPDFLPKLGRLDFVDGGAFDGDTIEHFMSRGIEFNEIYCFEPDTINQKALLERVRTQKITAPITLFPLALYSSNQLLKFTEGEGESSAISQEGATIVQGVSLDQLLLNKRVSFIKLDVEGGECEALRGSKNIIEKYRPVLAICVYHKPNDLWEIPLLVKELNPHYTIVLRTSMCNCFETVCYAYEEPSLKEPL